LLEEEEEPYLSKKCLYDDAIPASFVPLYPTYSSWFKQ
jgi:hypothetical protein